MSKLSKRIAQLAPCPVCAPHGGNWVPGDAGAYRRCPNPRCLRGKLLGKLDEIRRRDYDEVA